MDTEYHVYLPKLLESAAGLEQTARQQKQALADLQDTENRLKRLSYMEEVLRQLRRREQMMEERLQRILRMAQALRRIHQTLEDTENAVIDGIELPPPLYHGHHGHHGHYGHYGHYGHHGHGGGYRPRPHRPHRPPVWYYPPKPDCPQLPPIDDYETDTAEPVLIWFDRVSLPALDICVPEEEVPVQDNSSEQLYSIRMAEQQGG